MKHLLLVAVFLYSFNGRTQDKILISEDFNEQEETWIEGDFNKCNFTIQEGLYIIKSRQDHGAWNEVLLTIDPNKENFTIEAEFFKIKKRSSKKIRKKDLLNSQDYKIITTGSGAYGLIWSISESSTSFNRFLINSEGNFTVDEVRNGDLYVEQTWEKNNSINTNGGSNTLKIIKKANIVSYWINEREVFTSGYYSLFDAKFGFYVEGYLNIAIDRVEVKKSISPLYLDKNITLEYTAEKLGSNVNSEFPELGPIISPDGNTLYFAREYDPNNMGYKLNKAVGDIWKSVLLHDETWSKAINIGPPINNKGYNWVVSVATDNRTLLLANTYNEKGNPAGSGVSISNFDGINWSMPKTINIVGFYNNSRYVDYAMGPHNNIIIMSVERDDTMGQRDLYITKLNDAGIWLQPTTLGPVVNSFGDEDAPYLASDNRTLYFSSEGHPGYGYKDIFVSRRLDETWKNWSEPVNLGPEINTPEYEAGFSISAQADYVYLHRVDDIYRIKTSSRIIPAPTVLVLGNVISNESMNQEDQWVQYYDLELGTIIGKTPLSKDGSYQIILPIGGRFGVSAVSSNHSSDIIEIDLTKYTTHDKIILDIPFK